MNRKELRQRLDSYFRLELACAALIPATAGLLLIVFGQRIGPLSIWGLFVMSALLLVGGYYWYAKLKQLNGDQQTIRPMLALANRLKYPLLACVAIAITLCLADLCFVTLTVSTGDRIVAIVASGLAVLEYVNYYHRQLQHFDHPPDFRRLLAGRGFRRSQMSRDLDRYRSGTQSE